jgi:hypothetical protein
MTSRKYDPLTLLKGNYMLDAQYESRRWRPDSSWSANILSMRKITSPELQSAISRTREFYRMAYDSLNQLVATDLGTHVLFGYCNIAFEHYDSIAQLMDIGNHDSSALALIRCLVESVYKGLYVRYCATHEEIDQIRANNFSFKGFEYIASRLDMKFGVDKGFKIPGELWGLLNGYTHSGFEQLALQYAEDGSIEPNHTPDQLVAILEHCALDISLITTSTCEACGRLDLSRKIATSRKEMFPVSIT